MTTREIEDCLVYPQDRATTENHPQNGDPHSAAMKAAYGEALRGLDFVASGFDISSDGDALDIDPGKAVITADSGSVYEGAPSDLAGEELSDLALLVHPVSEESEIDLETTSGTNHVYLVVDLDEVNAAEYHVVDEETEDLGDVSLKIAEVDGDTVEEVNRKDDSERLENRTSGLSDDGTEADLESVSTEEAHRTGDIEDGLESVQLGGDIGYYLHDDFRDGGIETRTGQSTGPYYPSKYPSGTLYEGTYRPEWIIDDDFGSDNVEVEDGALWMGEDTHVTTPSKFEYGTWRYEFEMEEELDGNDISIPFLAETQFEWENNIEIQLRDDTSRIRTRDDSGDTSYIDNDGTFPNEAGQVYTLEIERVPVSEEEDRYRLYIDGELEIDETSTFDIEPNHTRLRIADDTPILVEEIEFGEPVGDVRDSDTELSHLEVRSTDADESDVGRIYLLEE